MLSSKYKARINRATRHNVPVQSAVDSFRKAKWFTVFLVVIFPIYPSLAAIGNISETQVGEYDDSSIITAFTDTEGLDYISETGLVTVDANNLSSSGSKGLEENKNVNIPDNKGNDTTKKDTTKDKKTTKTPVPKSNVKTYKVVENDDIIKISKKYNISPEAILWSNNLSMSDTLVVGQELKIPPVSGVVHTLKGNETVSELAKIYGIPTQEILEFNKIADPTKIPDGKKLLIPGAVKKPKPVALEKKVAQQTTAKPQKQQTKSANVEKKNTEKKVETPTKQEDTNPVVVDPHTGLKSRYKIKFTGLGRGFVPGNCTWHVARNKTVTWRGNAIQWIRNARAKGIPTGKIPIVGAIVQFSGHGYHPYYGHVGIVTDVTDKYIIVSDMNYRGLYEVTIRKVRKNDPAIDGYIYVD